MKTKTTLFFLAFFASTFLFSQTLYLVKNGQVVSQYELSEIDSITFKDPRVVYDIDGNAYSYGSFNGIDFMLSSLKTTKLNDGTGMVNGFSPSATEPRFFPTSGQGCHYNYFAVETGKICPVGWEVPSETQMEHIFTDVANQLGFTERPTYNQLRLPLNLNRTGYFLGTNTLFDSDSYTGFWRSDIMKVQTVGGHFYNMNVEDGFINDMTSKTNGLEIRCVRDSRL